MPLFFTISDDLDFHLKSQSPEQVKMFALVFEYILMNVNMQSQLVGLLKAMFSSYCTINIQGRKLCLDGFSRKNVTPALEHVTLYHFFQTHSDGRCHITLQFDSSLNELDRHLRSQVYQKVKTFVVIQL